MVNFTLIRWLRILGFLGLTRSSFKEARDQKIRLLESFQPINVTDDCGPPIGNCGFPSEKEPSNCREKISHNLIDYTVGFME